MNSILHRLNIDTSASALYRALTTAEGLTAWWTPASAETNIGGVAHFEFGPDPAHHVDMEIKRLEQDKLVVWQCVSGPWVGTGEFSFEISEAEQGVMLKFAHHGWVEADDFYMHCNSKWGFFLVISLKQYLESGTGLPHPQDPSI